MIKCATRRNLKYPLLLLIFNFLGDILNNFIQNLLEFQDLSFFIILMNFGKFLGGLIYYIKETRFLSKNKRKSSIHLNNIGYYKQNQNLPKDKIVKRTFLIFVASFHAFTQILISFVLGKFIKNSILFEERFRGILTIYTALLSYCLLKLNIYKHHRISIYFILSFLILLAIIEIIFMRNTNIFPQVYLVPIYFILSLAHIFCAFKNVIEKYLFENNQTSPYLVLLLEGIFGLIITIIFEIYNPPFDGIKRFYRFKSTTKFSFLIIGFIFYILLIGAKNLFRVLTTKIFDPMATTLMDYIFNPIYIIIIFSFLSKKTPYGISYWLYFVINLIISLIISFFGLVYNEIFILFCFGLDRETYKQITGRSIIESNISDLFEENDDDDEINIENTKSHYIMQFKESNTNASE